MSQTDARSLEQIKRDTEMTRAGLASTVEQLRTSITGTADDIRQRISPEAIKTGVSDYARDKRDRMLDDVITAARRNPMQAVAVGASVAYPLLKLARSIPLPVWMVGAGLFFAGSKTGQSAAKKVGDMASDLSDEARRRTHDLGQQVRDAASDANAFATGSLNRVSDAVSDGAEQLRQATGTARATFVSGADDLKSKASSFGAEQVTELGDRSKRAAVAAAATFQDFAAGATSTLRDAIGTTTDAGLNAAGAVRERASDLSDQVQKTFLQTTQDNALLVGGVGLLVGGLIASALPRSEIEDGLVGDASNAVKRRAQAAAAHGFETAKDTAGDIYDEVTRQAQDDGFTTEGFAGAAHDIGQRVRRIAESAVTTAFEPPRDDHQSNTPGDNHHG